MAHNYPLLLKELQLKVTPKRLAILDFLARTGTYVSPEEVRKKLKVHFLRHISELIPLALRPK